MVMRKNTDTIPAKLTPREAVLNRNAAELLGRDTIKRLNDHGNMLSKRGVDLAALPSDPTPGPSTENLLGYQYGTSMVQGDDRADLLRDAENTFYGGGTAPVPTPTPTPAPRRGYQYGTSSVDPKKRTNAASRYGLSFGSIAGPVGSTSFYAMLDSAQETQPQRTATYNPSASPNRPQRPTPTQQRPLTMTELGRQMAAQHLGNQGSMFGGTQQQPQVPTSRFPFVNGGYQFPAGSALPTGFQENNVGGLTPRVNEPTAARYSQQPFVEGGYNFPAGSQLPEGFQENQGGGLTRQPQDQGDQSTIHFLPPGFTAATGSTGLPNSSPNDVNFLPPGFGSVSGVVNPETKRLQSGNLNPQGGGQSEPQLSAQEIVRRMQGGMSAGDASGYGSAYGY